MTSFNNTFNADPNPNPSNPRPTNISATSPMALSFLKGTDRLATISLTVTCFLSGLFKFTERMLH
jgi:hypothetical protein